MDRFTTRKSPKGSSRNGRPGGNGGGGRGGGGAPAPGSSPSPSPGPSSSAPSDGLAGAVVSVVLSRSTGSTGSSASSSSSSSASAPVRLAVAVRTPRKRTSHSDPVRYSLEHFAFLDDRRRFTNLDSLLTRVGTVDVVYVGCTESAVVPSSGRRGSSSVPPQSQIRRSREVSDLLTKLSSVINSRTDIVPNDGGSSSAAAARDDNDGVAQIVPTLPKPLHNPTTASEFVDMTMVHLLGGEGTDRHLSYRGDRSLMDDPLPKRALGLLLLRTHEVASPTGYGGGDGTDGTTNMSLSCSVDESTRGTYQISPGTLSSYLVLDRTAAETVNLLPPRGGSNSGTASCLVGGNANNNSIFGVLNRCKTRMGGRTLEVWLRQPLVDLGEIDARHDAVAALVEDGLGRDRLRDEGLGALAGTDLDALSVRLGNAVVSGGNGGDGEEEQKLGISPAQALEVLYKMHVFAGGQLPKLVEALADVVGSSNAAAEEEEEKSASLLRSTLDGLNRVTAELGRCTGLVEAVLDLEAAPREFLVLPTFNDELAEVRHDLDTVQVDLGRVHDEMNELWSDVSGQPAGTVRLESADGGGGGGGGGGVAWQFRLPSTNDGKVLTEELDGRVKVHRILKNGVYFTTKDLRELGTRKQDLLAEYDRHQRDIVLNAMAVGRTYAPVLERASALIASLDVLASLAYVAAYSPGVYVRPTMTDSDEDGAGIVLRQARHPCVELQDTVSDYIPNDIALVYGTSSFLIVTGPNMGGKSTYIRSLASIVAMAQVGSFVPCASATINVVHHVLARVGAGDVQDRGISTFMAEMLEASSILQTATKRSLIIVDELGRGTSTFDGFGLARAISEYIVQRIGCMTVFATHFHELTVLEEKERCVRNCHVTARRASDGTNGLTFLYEVRPGPCLDSFGIAVGEMANLPPAVVADAKRKARQLENFDYRKKRKREEEEDEEEEGAAAAATDASSGGDDHADAEEQAGAMNFVNDFKKMRWESLSVEGRRQAVHSLIATHS